MRIGELSRQTGVSERLLRYYEEQGLLHPWRRPSGYREYADSDIQTVGRIRTLLSAGLGTSVIAQVLPCLADRDDLLVPTCPELVAGLGKERDRISSSIDELVAARTILDAILSAPVVAGAESGRYESGRYEPGGYGSGGDVDPTSERRTDSARAEPVLR